MATATQPARSFSISRDVLPAIRAQVLALEAIRAQLLALEQKLTPPAAAPRGGSFKQLVPEPRRQAARVRQAFGARVEARPATACGKCGPWCDSQPCSCPCHGGRK